MSAHGWRREGINLTAFVEKALREAVTVDDVIGMAESVKIAPAVALTVADRHGDAASLETTKEGVKIYRWPWGAFHTNHQLENTENLIKAVGGGNEIKTNALTANTLWRQQAGELFMKYAPERSVDALKTLFRSKPWNATAYGGQAAAVTVLSVIYDVRNSVAYICPDNPIWVEYTTIALVSKDK